MKRFIVVLIAMPLLVCSCSNGDEPDGPVVDKVYTIDKPYVFPVDNPYEFKDYDPSKYETNADMWKDLSVPTKIVGEMTSRALIETGIHHPYAPVYCAYNYPIMWVNVMMQNFNGFVELQKRKDCESEALKVYEKYAAEYNALCELKPDKNQWTKEDIYFEWHYEFATLVAKYFKVIPHDKLTDGLDNLFLWEGVQ